MASFAGNASRVALGRRSVQPLGKGETGTSTAEVKDAPPPARRKTALYAFARCSVVHRP